MGSTAGKVLSVLAVLFTVALVTYAVWPSGDTTTAGATSVSTVSSTAGSVPVESTETTASAVAPETTDTVVPNGHIVGTGTVEASNADIANRPIDASAPKRDLLIKQLTGLLKEYYTVHPADDTATWKSRVAPYVTDSAVLNDLNFTLDYLAPAPSKKRSENQTTSIGIFDIDTLQAESENAANTEYYILISVSLQTTKPDGSLFDTPQTVRNGTNWKFDGKTWVLTRFVTSDPLRR